MQLLTVFAGDRVLHSRVIEEERFEAGIEQQREGDALIGIHAEQRQGRAKRALFLQQVRGGDSQFLHGIAEALEIAAQVAGHEAAQLAQIGTDELLGQDQHVVLQQTEELQRALLLAFEERRRFRGDLRHLLAGLADPAAEDAVLERFAEGLARLRVDGVDAPRNSS